MAVKSEKIEATDIRELYTKFTFRKFLFITLGLILLGILMVVALSLGQVSLRIGDVFNAIVAKIFPFTGIKTTQPNFYIIWELRMPRILMAVIAGMGFAISGATMQGIMRNPLVSPFTIGISSGAGFGASLSIILGAGVIGSDKYLIVVSAFLFALIAVFLVYGIAKIRGVTSETLILAGIAVMYFFSAMTSFLQYIGSEYQLQAIVYWLFGSLAEANWGKLGVMTFFFLICFPFLMKYSWDLNALAGGDETAISLGVNIRRIRLVSMMLAVLITASIICFTGVIGFVCLVAPHITRMIIGADHRFLLPCSCITGALLLLGADTIARTVMKFEIPVGIVTAFIGVPMFIYLLITRKKQYWQ